MDTPAEKRTANPLFWALPLQAILFFWRLDLLEPWGDELFTLNAAPQSLQQIASIVGHNIHPPLYFDLLHLWIQSPWPGSMLAKMRAMSAIWGLLATVGVAVSIVLTPGASRAPRRWAQ